MAEVATDFRRQASGRKVIMLLLVAATIGLVTGTLAVAFRYLLLEVTQLFGGAVL